MARTPKAPRPDIDAELAALDALPAARDAKIEALKRGLVEALERFGALWH